MLTRRLTCSSCTHNAIYAPYSCVTSREHLPVIYWHIGVLLSAERLICRRRVLWVSSRRWMQEDPCNMNRHLYDTIVGSPRRSRREHRWKLLTPTVIWSIVILAMTPSLQGFGITGAPKERVGVAGGFSLRRSEAFGASTRPPTGGVSAGENQRPRATATSWLNRRLQAGRRMIQMKVLIAGVYRGVFWPLFRIFVTKLPLRCQSWCGGEDESEVAVCGTSVTRLTPVSLYSEYFSRRPVKKSDSVVFSFAIHLSCRVSHQCCCWRALHGVEAFQTRFAGSVRRVLGHTLNQPCGGSRFQLQSTVASPSSKTTQLSASAQRKSLGARLRKIDQAPSLWGRCIESLGIPFEHARVTPQYPPCSLGSDFTMSLYKPSTL